MVITIPKNRQLSGIDRLPSRLRRDGRSRTELVTQFRSTRAATDGRARQKYGLLHQPQLPPERLQRLDHEPHVLAHLDPEQLHPRLDLFSLDLRREPPVLQLLQ